jgi:hypothetical protein
MTISRQEEIIGALWIIAALIAYNINPVIGWILAAKGGFSIVQSIISWNKDE